MMTTCPECGLPVSDKAFSCPHCGYPFKGFSRKSHPGKNRMRLPNGFGQISEIKNQNLRKPFRAMVTVGKDENGKPICRILRPNGYFKTYNEAYAALAEYHKSPYDLDNVITMEELYARWSTDYFKSLKSDSSIRTIRSSWAYCSQIYKMPVKEVRARHLKGVIDSGFVTEDSAKKYATANKKGRIKSLFNLMLDYAVEYEIVDRNYARTFNLGSDVLDEGNSVKRGHKPYTDAEMQTLWANIDREWVDVILIQAYSGWRPQELGELLLESVDLNNWTFTGGMKTDAGTDRVVPIHPRIRELVKAQYDRAVELGSKYLFNCTDTQTHRSSYKLTYDKYQQRYGRVRDELGLNPEHRPHDGRKHFVTMAKKYKVDEYAIKYMVGHAINDITEKVYTERDVEWLQEEIAKIA